MDRLRRYGVVRVLIELKVAIFPVVVVVGE
jgi:hypothetical protein